MDKISIIIPVYKVEEYLKDAVESVRNQTYKNLEIILVDDGSPDNSGKMCDEYAKEDNRIKVIHKENGGLSDARNFGLNVITGKYVMFLDSDDFYELNACETLYNEIEKRNADYVIANYINTSQEGEKWQKPIFDINKYNNFKLSITDYEKSFFVMNSSVGNKMFRKSFIDKLNLKFVKGLPAEDAIFTTYCFVNSDKVFYIKDIVYNYRQISNSTSISTNCTTKYFQGINNAYRLIYNNFKESNNIGFYRYFYAKSVSYMLCKLIDSNLMTDKEKIETLKLMKWFYKMKLELKAGLTHKSLDEIADSIIENDFEKAIQKMHLIKEYRNGLTKEEREKMSKPSTDMYNEMSKYDNEYKNIS